MVVYASEWCAREDKTKWCRRIAREKRTWTGFYLGVAGCYRPHDSTICLGKENIINAWMYLEEEKAVRFLVDVLCHEEDHRAVHEVTESQRTALLFDYLFGHPFNYEANLECFRVGDVNSFLGKELTPYGKMIVEKPNNKEA